MIGLSGELSVSVSKGPGMFDGASTGARRFGILGVLVFVAGTLVIGVYVGFVQGGDRLVSVGLPALWLVVVALRVGPATRERELSAFVEVMKWQIAIGAAAAAIIAPIGLDPEGHLNLGFAGPVFLFLVSSGFAAVGYALVREASLQIEGAAAKRASEEQARLLEEAVKAAVASSTVSNLQAEIQLMREEITRLDQPWWKRWH